MAPEYTDDQEEGEYTCSKISSFSYFFQIHPTNSLFFQNKSLHASSCLLLIITHVEILQIKGVFHVFFGIFFFVSSSPVCRQKFMMAGSFDLLREESPAARSTPSAKGTSGARLLTCAQVQSSRSQSVSSVLAS